MCTRSFLAAPHSISQATRLNSSARGQAHEAEQRAGEKCGEVRNLHSATSSSRTRAHVNTILGRCAFRPSKFYQGSVWITFRPSERSGQVYQVTERERTEGMCTPLSPGRERVCERLSSEPSTVTHLGGANWRVGRVAKCPRGCEL